MSLPGACVLLGLSLVLGGRSVLGQALAPYSVSPVVLAQPTPHYVGDTVTLAVKDSSISYVVKALTQQAHMQLLDDSSDPLLAKRISVHVVRMNLMDALAVILKGTGLVATVAPDGVTVVVRAAVSGAAGRPRADGGSIVGTVTDSATGNPIEGAKVSVQDTKVATTSSETGAFILTDVPSGDQAIIVRTFGYKPFREIVHVVAGERRTVRVVMTATATILSGVVTTATGQQQKLAVGSDITTINVDSVMKTAPINSVTDLLENRVPGLTVVHTSGTPGDPSRLLLRGAASVLGNNSPIVVIDGVRAPLPSDLGSVQEQVSGGNPGTGTILTGLQTGLPRPSPLDQIDPNSIETIEVLKGPSASALYGSDAANGVIVITTKKGTGGKTRWDVSLNQGVDYIPGSYPTFTYVFGHTALSGAETQCVAGVITKIVGVTRQYIPCIADSVRSYQALNDPRISPLTHGLQSTASATVSGGAQALTYSFTGSAQNQHGDTKMPDFSKDEYQAAMGTAPPGWMTHPDDYVGGSGTGNIQAVLSPAATLSVGSSLSNTTQHRTNLGLSAVGDLIGVYVDTGSLADYPAFTDLYTKITAATLTSASNATLNWQIRPWLPLTVTAGYNSTLETDKQYYPSGLPSSLGPAGFDTGGYYSLGKQQSTVTTLNANTTIPISVRSRRIVSLAVGTNFVSQSADGIAVNSYGIPVGVSDPTTFPQTQNTVVQQSAQSASTYGWFAEPQLLLLSRVYWTPGIRFDGGTASGSAAGVAVFPKTNVSYILMDHSSDLGARGWTRALTLLRLRGAFGIAGVQPTPGQNLRLFTSPQVATLNGGTTVLSSSTLSTIGNPTLHPERSQEVETGFDAQFFQNRASLTATYYRKLRIDAIEGVPVAPSVVGTETEYANVGNILNQGLELSTTATVLDLGPVQWDINASISHNANRVLSVTNSNYDLACTGHSAAQSAMMRGPCVRKGYPLDAQFGKQLLGYTDLNQDGLIEYNELSLSDSAVYLGSPDPRYTASFGTTIALWHGRLSVSASGDYQNGLLQSSVLMSEYLQTAANAPDATVLARIYGIRSLNTADFASLSQVVNTLRFDTFSANVTLPTAVARIVGGAQATLSLQGSNLGLWSNYGGTDPNVSSVLNGLGVSDGGQIPQPRTWRIAVRIFQ